MAEPEVAIDVDPETGVWTTDGLPMLYVPRHFLLNNHLMTEQALGRDAYADLLYDAGHRSAYTWCRHEAETAGLDGMAVFHRYLQRLSQRGWGRFDGSGIDPFTGCGSVTVRSSCFVLHQTGGGAGPLCYMFAGWFPGALAWVARDRQPAAKLASKEVRCAADGHEHCVFEISADPST